MKSDDASLDPSATKQVRKYADLLLRKADAYGRLPTPIDDLLKAAELEIARENVLDKIFLGSLYRGLPNAMKLAPDRIKSAVGKVMGLLDRRDRMVHIDKELHPKKVVFLSLHEVGHDFLPWQRKTFDILEDSESELDPETRERYEREANCFSSDVLFQLDNFTKDASDSAFGIKSPLALSKRYGASFYATARRFVVTSSRPCALVVFNRDEDTLGGERLIYRRSAASRSFLDRFGVLPIPEVSSGNCMFFRSRPFGRFRAPTPCVLNDLNQDKADAVIEGFDSSYEVFFLLYPLEARPESLSIAF